MRHVPQGFSVSHTEAGIPEGVLAGPTAFGATVFRPLTEAWAALLSACAQFSLCRETVPPGDGVLGNV